MSTATPEESESEPTIGQRVEWLAKAASETEIAVLLHLRAHTGKSLRARAVATALKLPIAATEQHLAALCGRGFLSVTLGSDLAYAYQSAKAIDDVLDTLELGAKK